jgi:hypothetical protein
VSWCLLRQTSARTEEHVLPKAQYLSIKSSSSRLLPTFRRLYLYTYRSTINKNMEPAKSKNEAIITRAKGLANVPWCEEYEKMISGML